MCDGVFERYWVKPESGKNARPTPPNNPDVKWQKHKGPCRIRIEPHIFETEVYVEEKPKPQPVKQYVPPQQSAFGQPYRPNQQAYGQQQQQNQHYQSRTLPPLQHTSHAHPRSSTLPSIKNMSPHPPSRAQHTSPQPAQQEKKASPDPVISMLANRASSNPELKALMKEVATGNATPDQLKIFQGHIDELTKITNERKKEEEKEEAAAAAAAAKVEAQQSEMIQYDGPADSVPGQQQTSQRPYQPPQQPIYQQQQAWTAPPPPPAPTSLPVVLTFTTPGATEDRFLFPQHSILEALSQQHLLASFIVTRKGREAADPTGLDPNTEYWQPVTLMVEVAYSREAILDNVRRWVKPAEEVRKHMEGVMRRCMKAPDAYLALRLPYKGTTMAETAEDMEMAELATPVVQMIEEKVKPKSNVKYIKKAAAAAMKGAPEAKTTGETKEGDKVTAAPMSTPAQTAPAEQNDTSTIAANADGTAAASETTETGRPKRAVRKSVRISEG